MGAADPFDALADPNRRAILQLLGDGARSVQELADELPISRPAVSRHLRLLKEASLVTDTTAGTRRLYRLRDDGAATISAYMHAVWGDVAGRFTLAAENTTPRRRQR
jgi:DNA-binding transcriptional ArsR family regulator